MAEAGGSDGETPAELEKPLAGLFECWLEYLGAKRVPQKCLLEVELGQNSARESYHDGQERRQYEEQARTCLPVIVT